LANKKLNWLTLQINYNSLSFQEHQFYWGEKKRLICHGRIRECLLHPIPAILILHIYDWHGLRYKAHNPNLPTCDAWGFFFTIDW
jgi:hypothetical protein